MMVTSYGLESGKVRADGWRALGQVTEISHPSASAWTLQR
jgi:hypothetical protein